MKINAYGRDMEILRENDAWCVYILGAEGKKREAGDIRIPPSTDESELLEYLSDLLHEYASTRHPEVTLVE